MRGCSLKRQTAREREKLSRILSNVADVVIVVDDDDRVVLVNPAARAVLNLKADSNYIGLPFMDVIGNAVLRDLYGEVFESGRGMIGEVPLPDERVFYANLTPAAGIGTIIVMHDITPLKETDRLKSELVATVSHDLKQPLSVMHGYSELLLMLDDVSPAMASYIGMIQRSISNMRQLIDDLLDLAKIESGVELEPQPVHAHDLINMALDVVRPAAAAKQMEVTVDLPATLPLIQGDVGYLKQVFTNLIGNAVKYTPAQGQIAIWAEPNRTHLRIAIRDNGLGISPEDQAHIFDRFYRVRRAETDSIDGTGLGLAIVKRLVELHGGLIDLESSLGAGSTFYVMLPVAQTANADVPLPA